MVAMGGEGILEGHSAELSRSWKSTAFQLSLFVFLLHFTLSKNLVPLHFFFLLKWQGIQALFLVLIKGKDQTPWTTEEEGLSHSLRLGPTCLKPSGNKNMNTDFQTCSDTGCIDWMVYLKQLEIPTQPESSAVFGKQWTEKVMAPHSRTLAWKIPWTEEPGEM